VSLPGKEKHFGTGLQNAKDIAIGIDQSLTGFAFSAVSVNDPNLHETWVYKSPYNGVQRLYDISSWMRGKFMVLAGHRVVDIAMEGTVLASHSALVLGELSATVKLTLWVMFSEREPMIARPLQIPPMTLKKYATGKGTSKKQEMLMQMYKRWQVEFNDDNAADAYALARLAGKVSIDATERAVVEQILDIKYRDAVQ
jgi:Holliday junction resolvasome RuvABC endonuclease subunit